MIAFSLGAYVALSKAIFTEAAVVPLTVTVTSFEVAVAAETVAASITLNLAVPIVAAVTGQRMPVVEFQAAH